MNEQMAGHSHVSRPLSVVVLILQWLPLVALAAAAGFAFGWRVPVAFAAMLTALVVRAMRRRPARRSRVRTALDMALMTVLGGVIGGVLLGGVWALMGGVVGFTFALAEVPLSVKNERGELREFDSRNAAQSARLYKQVALLMTAAMIIGGVLVIVVALTQHS